MTQVFKKSLSIKEVQQFYCKKLPIKELDLLLEFILNKPYLNFIIHPDEKIDSKKLNLLNSYIKRRLSGEPIAYIVGQKEFYGRLFKVTKDTLVPRPESELIIDILKDFMSKNEKYVFLDIGTGSGNLITTLACEFLNFTHIPIYVAVDISTKALNVAKKNFNTLSPTSKLITFNSDLLKNVKLLKYLISACKKTDNLIIVANLPYVDRNLKNELLSKKESCGLAFEPDNALWSDDYGLWHYKKLIPQLINLKSKLPHTKITAIYEINDNQKNPLVDFIKITNLLSEITVHKDLANKNRIVKHTF